MANSRVYTDKENVKITHLEYDKDNFEGMPKYINKNDYIGTVSHIYDNTNGAEEQNFVYNTL
ncbi:hypothetical protein [Streptococcus oricebi]|uniref:Uncharacterized protein n=1 Tax=Streptococcus oricebi TaxID=1547447 RepID=A0ABS5B0S8_9STRE|nr:hypothetical protein [Streptococcus oricebi]MBP2622432.1 hypothetical protein [Streptococcus oricebi]